MGGDDKEAAGPGQGVPSKCRRIVMGWTGSMLSEENLKLDIGVILEMGGHSRKTSSLGTQKKMLIYFCDAP